MVMSSGEGLMVTYFGMSFEYSRPKALVNLTARFIPGIDFGPDIVE